MGCHGLQSTEERVANNRTKTTDPEVGGVQALFEGVIE